MEILSYNIEDFEKLETLLQSSTEISSIYDKLCELEINSQKDSKEYEELLTKLSKLIKKEKDEYQKINFSHKDCIKYLKLLEAKTNIHGMDTRITSTLAHYKNRIIKRIMNNLVDVLERNRNFHQEIINKEIVNSFPNIIKNIPTEALIKSVGDSAKIQTAINNDIQNMFLSILEETILSKFNKDYRRELIQAKYCILFTNKNMESLFISRNFDIPDIVYISSKIINQLVNSSEFGYDSIKYITLKSLVKTDINNLLNLNDSDYKNHNVYFNSIICKCHIRAALSLMPNSQVDQFNEEFHEIIENKKYLEKNQNNRISEDLIMSCFKCFNHDKEKVRILSAKSDK